jgi:hypothetical protein
MPLNDILTDISKDAGQTGTVSETNVRIADINNAIREIHESANLPEACTEDIFGLVLPSQQVNLPHYVDKVLGMRYVDGRVPVDRDSMGNRYFAQNAGEHEVWYLQWRDRGLFALSREIANQSILKFAFPATLFNSVAFTLTITGRTDRARRATEV